MVASVWMKSGLLAKEDSAFVREAVRILKNSLELVVDADVQLRELLDYPLEASIAQDEKVAPLLEDNFAEVRHRPQHAPLICLLYYLQYVVKPSNGDTIPGNGGPLHCTRSVAP